MDELKHPEPSARQDSFLPRISVTRPVTVTMCLVALLVVGAVAYSRLSVQAFPSGWEWRWLYVGVDRRGTSPQEVDRNIRRPIEEHLRTVKGYRRIRASSSTQWGLWLGLEFRQDIDLDLAYNQMMDRLERAKLDLPEEVRDFVFLWKFNQETDWEVMWVGVQLPDGVGEPREFADIHIRRHLERLKGVARVGVWGTPRREVMIELDNQKMQTRGINHFQLLQTLRQDNFALSGGFVREGGKKYFVRSTAHYRSLEEIANIPLRFPSARVGGQVLESGERLPSARAVEREGSGLRSPPDFVDIRVKDIANVTYRARKRMWVQKINGKSAIAIGIFRESGENIVDVCNRASAALDEIADRTGTRFDVFFNQGEIVERSMANLRNTGIWGGLFAATVLLYFLQTIRMTALITLSIPLCVMIALLGIYLLDWSLNSMTMMGLMVGVGMVVDNAIVIVENIYRLRAKGQDPHRASIVGASEVGLAITMATLTTVVVFLPLMLMSGSARTSFYLSKMGLPVVFSLLGSLFVALLFIPVAAKRFGDARVGKEPKTVQRTRVVYLRALEWCLNHRRDAIILVLAISATALYPMENIKSGGRGSSWDASQNIVRIRVDGPNFFGFDMMDSVMTGIEEILEPKREAYDIRTIRTWYDDDYGQVIVFLHHPPNQEWWNQIYRNTRAYIGYPVDGRMDRKMVIEDMNEIMPEYVGVKLSVQKRFSREDAGVDVNFYGEDFETLAGLLEEAERRIRRIPSILSTETDLERGASEVQVTVHREQARRLGFSPAEIGRSISYLVEGAHLNRLQVDEREIAVRLQLAEQDRQTLMQLKSYLFKTPEGEAVPLASFSDFKISKGSGTIRREDGRMKLRIKVTATKDDIDEFYTQINQVMAGFSMPRGYSWDKGEHYSKLREKKDEMIFAILMAVTFVFLLMGVLFESVILPFSVILSIPLAFFGVYWTLYLTDTKMDDMASMGCVVLIGVVVNNAIVLVDMINRLREDGTDRMTAILEAGHNRYRPILMTTFTTVFGLIPMAVSVANMMGMPIAPLGRTMMGGLISSTFLTLVVVPIFYTLFDDFRLALRRLAHGAFAAPGQEEALVGLADNDD